MMQPLVRRAVILGQFLALLIAATASFSTALARNEASFPTMQSALNYFLLALVYGSIHFWRGGAQSLSRPVWQYALLAALDVEANFVIVTAFRYTSLTSVTLLDCWSIPVALALTRVLGLAAYRQGHYAGAALCVLGLALLVATDNRMGQSGEAAETTSLNVLLGDALVVLGATIYAACNVLQEHLLGDVAASELLCMLGSFGFLYSLLQSLPLELPAMLAASWSPAIIGPWIGFGVSMFLFYSLVPYQLSWGGAAMLNLSLLSSDLWTALARLLFFGGFSVWSGVSFLLSFALLASGIAIYSMSGDAKHVDTAQKDIVGSAIHRPSYLPLNTTTIDRETERLPSVYAFMGRGIDTVEEEEYRLPRESASTAGGVDLRETELSSSPPAARAAVGSTRGGGLVPKESPLDKSHSFQP